ncbi:MAG TPA: tetratricopeptide repeat protein [Clostridia bacterium]|nr:tetratricopeptide repeat protein [Clostridia bacterium]
MKRLFALVLLVVFALQPIVHAQSLDDQYVQVFNLIQEADDLYNNAPGQALAKYVQAQSALERIKKGSPTWNIRVIDFRLTYVASRIAALSAKAPEAAAVATDGTNKQPATAQSPPSSGAPADWQLQLNSFKEQVHQLQADKVVLETKLKEALALQPAESDPRELAKAEEKIKALQKENDLLKTGLEQAKSESQTAAVPKASEQNVQEMDALKAENQLLKKRLTELQAAAADKKANDAANQLAQLQTQMAALQSDRENLRVEKAALESKIKELTAATAISPKESSRMKKLERERDELQKKLESANKDLKGRKGKVSSNRIQELEDQLLTARLRLELLEARAVPYSPEELALFKRPETKLAEAEPKAGKKSVKELPAGSAKLVAEAQRHFAARQYVQAETAYLQILKQDEKCVPALANLAAIQIEAQQFDKAEASIKQALASDPEDAFSLYTLGILKFRQAKYDEALEALSHSAKLDPQNAEVQNYLGLALSEKGLRGPAETALRKAVQLQPGYGGAHYNLAIVYLNQQPPAVELARWHYQKAISAGHPQNADVEKKLKAQ